MRTLIFASLVLASAPVVVHANGRPAGTSTINFKQGDDTQILAGMTFGALKSIDGGVTWHWICENAIGYGGVYDPDYSFTSTGRIVASREQAAGTAPPPSPPTPVPPPAPQR